MVSSDQDIRHRLLLARLPAMPEILLKLLDLCQTDEAGMAELALLVEKDPAITAKVMTIANSAAYRRDQASTNLLQALDMLGTDMLKVLVISESVQQLLKAFPHAGEVSLRGFWLHSLKTAILAREIAKHMNHALPEEAYLGGLLHDIGRLALLAAAPNDYTVNFQAEDDDTLCAGEQRALNITHAEAGAWLIERWKLDSFLADSVLYHHEPTPRVANASTLIRIIHLAHLLANLPDDTPPPAGTGAVCQIKTSALTNICQAARGQLAHEASLFNIDLQAPATGNTPPAIPVDPVQRQLDEDVRHIALTAEIGLALSRQPTEAQRLDLVRRSARVLFHLDDSIVLRMDDSGHALVAGAVGTARQRLNDFTLPLREDSALALAVRQQRPAFLAPAQTQLSLPEMQLLRLFEGAEGLLYLPLPAGAHCQGVLVSGVPRAQGEELLGRQRLLQAFASQIGRALQTGARTRDAQEHKLASLREDFELQARKVAHEVNNPLGIMKNYLGVLDDKLVRQQPVGEELAILHEEIDRVDQLVQRHAGAARQALAATRHADLNRIAHQLAALFRGSRFLPAGVQLEVRTPEQPAPICGEADTLKQILINLVKNAIEALPSGGLIEIINQGPVHQDGRMFFHLLVRDDGPGLPPAVLQHLFAPVPSTKTGSGRGLGLSIVHDLVRQLGGSIRCASNSTGTTFDILLPQGEGN